MLYKSSSSVVATTQRPYSQRTYAKRGTITGPLQVSQAHNTPVRLNGYSTRTGYAYRHQPAQGGARPTQQSNMVPGTSFSPGTRRGAGR